MQELLLDDLEGTSAKIETGCSVKSFEQRPGGGVRVTTEDGRAFEADALVGADGIWSNVRSQLWEQPARGEGSGCTYSGYTVFAGESTYQTSDYFETGYKVCFTQPNPKPCPNNLHPNTPLTPPNPP